MRRLRIVSRLAALEISVVSGLVVVLILAVISTRPARVLREDRTVLAELESISPEEGTPGSLGHPRGSELVGTLERTIDGTRPRDETRRADPVD